MINKLFYVVAWLAIISAGLIMVTLAYWAFYPYHIIDFALPVPVVNEDKQVVRGEKIYLKTTYDKHLQVNGHGESFIICEDGNLVTVLPPRSVGVAFPIGKHTFNFDMTVPEKTSLGSCHFESVIAYEVNPIRKVPITIYSEQFEVVE